MPEPEDAPPVLTWYEGSRLDRLALPLGGIGTGTVSIGGRGHLRDFEMVNQPAKGVTPADCLLALWTRDREGRVRCRALEGPIPTSELKGAFGSRAPNPGLPRFERARCGCAYPFARIELDDGQVPLRVRLDAWNPLVPGDADASGWPVAALRVVLTNEGEVPLDASLLATHRHWLAGAGARRIETRRAGDLTGVFFSRVGGSRLAREFGTLSLAMSGEVQVREGWLPGRWQRGRQQLWRDFIEDGRLDPQPEDQPEVAALCRPIRLEPGATVSIPLHLCWHFPNRAVWPPGATAEPGPARVGNHYCERFTDAWDVARRFHEESGELEERTRRFVCALSEGDIPDVLVEAGLSNLSTLRSTTVFRLPTGELYGFEGSGDAGGCCPGSCTHVWNYELATPFLFADLARSMRDVEFLHATDEEGLQSFRVLLPLGTGGNGLAAADGQLGSLVKLYREWRLCGDDAWLARLWPRAKRALEFCWLPGSWDADLDGVIEGCQHNTMDVEYYGPHPQIQGWYLAALRAAAAMARRLDDVGFAERCDELRVRGTEWMDEHLFNGDYFEQQIRPARPEDVRPGLRSDMGPADPTRPTLQLGAGCLIDQLVGECMARLCGLGGLHDPDHVHRTLRSILQCNRREGFHDHLNPMRVYALSDETGLLMASYPRGEMPADPFPYHAEVMTGFEYVVGIHCLLEGMIEEGLRVFRDVRSRYDGDRRNPFDEAECGHHYVRAMASWGGILAWTGFHYDAVEGTFSVRSVPTAARWFWSSGSAWGTIAQRSESPDRRTASLEVCEGEIRVERLRVGDREGVFAEPRRLGAGERLEAELPPPSGAE
jgi:uncharacterized protein (DUF608 family)